MPKVLPLLPPGDGPRSNRWLRMTGTTWEEEEEEDGADVRVSEG
jgi:hypothetical protein